MFGLHFFYGYLQPDILLFTRQKLRFGCFLFFLGRVGGQGFYGEGALAQRNMRVYEGVFAFAFRHCCMPMLLIKILPDQIFWSLCLFALSGVISTSSQPSFSSHLRRFFVPLFSTAAEQPFHSSCARLQGYPIAYLVLASRGSSANRSSLVGRAQLICRLCGG